MKKETTTVTVTCDLCGSAVDKPCNGATEDSPIAIVAMAYDIWYGGTYDVRDVCQGCQLKVGEFFRQFNFIGRGQK